MKAAARIDRLTTWRLSGRRVAR